MIQFSGSRISIPRSRRGAALVMAMVALLVVSLMAAALVRSLVAAHRQANHYADELQAQWLAEAGLQRALVQLKRDANYKGETWQTEINDSIGTVTIAVDPTTKKINVEAVYPPEDHRRILVQREASVANPEPLNPEP